MTDSHDDKATPAEEPVVEEAASPAEPAPSAEGEAPEPSAAEEATGQAEAPAEQPERPSQEPDQRDQPAEPDPEERIAELTADLQRLQAEYVNYKRRVDRDRELLKQNATYAALAPIVEVLDTIDRAREHEPLEGGFKATAEQLERVVSSVGLVKFGEPGEPFDPNLHEALSHLGSDADVDVTTIKVVAKAGYKIGDRVVRAAQVLVVDPE